LFVSQGADPGHPVESPLPAEVRQQAPDEAADHLGPVGTTLAGIGQLSKESLKGLGPSAPLITGLPTTVLVLSVFAIFASDLYPWLDDHKDPDAGIDSVVAAATELGVGGGIAFVLALLVTAVLIRPLHIAAVQLLEGYWAERAAQSVLKDLATEHHQRRFSRAAARRSREFPPAPTLFTATQFDTVARRSRRRTRFYRRSNRAAGIADTYPPAQSLIMPTLLGNVLKRAETTAGERYGLDTVSSYPRLYPHLSQKVSAQITMQLDLLDTNGTFAVVFAVLAGFATPIAWRGGWWFCLPALLCLLAWMSYRGAIAVARNHGRTLAAAYDLHRFDFLEAMHLPLPSDPAEERDTNRDVSRFLLTADQYVATSETLDIAPKYEHPPEVHALEVPGGSQASGDLEPSKAAGSGDEGAAKGGDDEG